MQTLLMALPLIVGAIIMLAVGLLIRSFVRLGRGGPALRRPSNGALRTVLLVGALGVSLFIGFVGAAIVGALVPQAMAFAADFACPGNVIHDSYDYSYKPGQSGTTQVFRCLRADTSITDITAITYVYASLTFSAGAFVVLLLLAALVGPRLRSLASMAAKAVAPKADAGRMFEDFMADARTAQPVQPAEGRNLADRLRELEELYRKGVINREEYEAARARMLAEI